MKVNLLKAKMLEKEVTPEDISKMLGFKNVQTFYNRLNGKVDITLTEIKEIKKYLCLTQEETNFIFFNDN